MPVSCSSSSPGPVGSASVSCSVAASNAFSALGVYVIGIASVPFAGALAPAITGVVNRAEPRPAIPIAVIPIALDVWFSSTAINVGGFTARMSTEPKLSTGGTNPNDVLRTPHVSVAVDCTVSLLLLMNVTVACIVVPASTALHCTGTTAAVPVIVSGGENTHAGAPAHAAFANVNSLALLICALVTTSALRGALPMFAIVRY